MSQAEGPVGGQKLVFQKLVFPPVTPEGLFREDQRRMNWDERERKIDREIAEARRRGVINEHWESTI